MIKTEKIEILKFKCGSNDEREDVIREFHENGYFMTFSYKTGDYYCVEMRKVDNIER